MSVRWVVLSALILCLAGVALATRAASRRERVQALMSSVPRLSADMARHLVLDDEAAFARHARAVGSTELRGATFALGLTIHSGSADAYARSWAAVMPFQLRIARALADQYASPDYLSDLEYRATLPPERGVALRRLMDRETSIRTRPGGDANDRIPRLEQLIDEFHSIGYTRGVMMAEATLANEVIKVGRGEERLRHLRLAVGSANQLNATLMQCQLLGELGAAYSSIGRIDSMWICYEQALRIAKQCRIPDQFSRILLFEARHSANEGRLAAATDLIVEAQRQCREMGGSGLELRFVVGAMDHFAELGCWEIVEQLLQRCPVLARSHDGFDAPRAPDFFQLGAEQYRIYLLLAHEHFDEAITLLRRIEPSVRRLHPRTGYANLLEGVSARLVAAGHPAEALPWIEKGLVHCDSLHVPEYALGLALSRAQARFATGSPGAARAALEDFDRRVAAGRDPGALGIARDLLDARLRARADPRAARHSLQRALSALHRHAQTLEAGPQGYLALSGFGDLRDASLQMLATSPEDGYRFELAWRALPAELGRGSRMAPSRMDRLSRPPAGSWHVVYRFGPDVIIRWTATKSGITRDTLALGTEKCRLEIDAIRRAMTGGEFSPELQLRLHRLASVLLPAHVMLAEGNPPQGSLLVTPDGPLALLPFELLNVSASGYEPIAKRWDVAYGERPARSQAARTGPCAILVDPLPSPELRRNAAPEALQEAGSEAEAVQRAWPGSRLLQGQEATKPAVLASWRDASRIHVAAHLMRNPEIPFIAYFPMAQSTPDAPANDGYLEMADIRATDLSGCELVVLSACASGAPYVASRNRLGPSMGDAFLDAGARAVIQTFWAVADADARRFVERFIATWKPGTDPVAALADARRAALRAGEPPWVWAAWSIHLAGAPWSRPATSAATSSLARVP